MDDPPKKVEPPGWNDPPMLNYSSTNPPPKSRIMNKRVPFPLGSSQNPKPVEVPKLPPLVPEPSNQVVESVFLKASENFNNMLASVNDENIKEQVWLMLSHWQGGKFNGDIQNSLWELSRHLVENDTAKANELLLRVTMENAKACHPFLPALKYLLNIPK